MQKLTKLSRSAKALFDTTKLPRVLARRVGQFLGTDLAYNPGDLFVRYDEWANKMIHPTHRYVNLVRISERGGRMRWYDGRRFAVFRVLRVTPQTLTVRKIKVVDVYFKWNKNRDMETDEVAGVFSFERSPLSLERQPQAGIERLYIRKSDADAMREYKNLDMTKAQKFAFHNYLNTPRTSIWLEPECRTSRILHDVETNSLVVENVD
jgi:hypothetical protein